MSALKVLIVHNAYQMRGGEDAVVDAEFDLLRDHGHEVEIFKRTNEDLINASHVKAAIDAIWSKTSVESLTTVINKFRPDIVHFHNTFPLISPSAYWAVRALGLPVIQTLHNFRLHCPQAMYLREGNICEKCRGHVPWQSVVHGCYRNSRSQSAVISGMLIVHRILRSYHNKVTRYIALNDFCRRKFIEGGLPAERILVKPNFVNFGAPSTTVRSGFLFIGRLSKEKGIEVLVGGWEMMKVGMLEVGGVGPEAHLLENIPNLSVLGNLSSGDVRERMGVSQALILPSICYDSFPRTLVEAFACSLPVIASRLGPLEELVDDGVTGLLFEPGNAADLARKLSWAQENPDLMVEMGRNARIKYETDFSPERNYSQLISIYEEAISAVEMENL